MDKRNEHRFFPIHVITLLISCLTVMGCYNPDWSDKDADFLITQAKTNENKRLRRKAVYLLAEKTQERDKVIPALTHVLLNDEIEHIRFDALDALGSIEPPAFSAIPALIEALQHDDTGVALVSSYGEEREFRSEMIRVLGELGPAATEAIPALTEVFRNDERYPRYVRNGAGLAILKIAPSMHTVKEELIERRAVWQLAVLAEAGDVSLVPVLIKLLNEPDSAYPATEALKNIGTPEALDALVAYYIQRLDYPEAGVRASAAKDLKDIGTPEALEAVKQFEKRRWWPF